MFREITIAGEKFAVPARYSAGHPLTENEAKALNQVLAENLRNNFASKVKEGKEAGISLDDIRLSFAEYANAYEFGAHISGGGGAAVRDPVETEARSLARGQIVAHLRAQGRKVSDVPADKLAAAIDALLERDPSIREMAEKRVEEKRALAARATANDPLADLDLGPDEEDEDGEDEDADGEDAEEGDEVAPAAKRGRGKKAA